ncbi:hypothetical protein AVEN_56339-1 [Araneus ventricosus]|uniref:Uncharacterized protein n=1 Tax=Araneus ventricosus TaxID=182803 RepID=A0A4Y2WW34_ARAVE|nr:hypothetical protein AVEN_224932-1 [Araneus ventricosus]GBO40693.1 hypothetical protein AVEN_56339-1 [Araneus ventricosus]
MDELQCVIFAPKLLICIKLWIQSINGKKKCVLELSPLYYRAQHKPEAAVVRSRDRKVPGSKPNSTEDPPGPLLVKSYVGGQTCSHWCSEEVWREGHLTAVQNDEVRPKIALVSLRNGTLI